MALLSEIDGGSVPAWTIKCEVENKRVPGSDGIVDEIRFYHMKLLVGDSTYLTELVYANEHDLSDAEEGIRYRVNYNGTAESADEALKYFESYLFQKFWDVIFKPTR
jgi:hypothetical protein